MPDYIPQTWVDDSVGGTPVSAARLNYMEAGIDTANDTADDAASDVAAAAAAVITAQSTADSATAAAGAAQTTANGAVPKSTVTTKGDLIVASASATVGRLQVGTDGRLLTADSSQTLGMKWGRKITVSATAPGGPSEGDIWIQPGASI